jgi:phosphate transport system protein
LVTRRLSGTVRRRIGFGYARAAAGIQRQLDAIDAKVIELFDLVAADLARATPALRDGNSEVVKVLAEHGLVIDPLCPEIERRVKTAILLQAPVASDLRFLLCVLRILPELERSHHLVVRLASKASHIRSEDLSPPQPGARRANGEPRI